MSRGRVFSFDEARKNATDNPRARWAEVAPEFSAEVFPNVPPSFAILRGQTVLGLGVGFARVVEKHLAHAGCRAPMRELSLPAEEWSGDASEAMGQLHPPAVRQSLEWAAGILDRDGVVTWDDCAPLAFECGKELFVDLGLGATPPATRERFLERRRQIYEVLRSAFSAQCLVIAPAMIEAWRDAETGRYLHDAPSQKEMGRSGRFELEVLTYEQCVADLLAAIDVVRARNPEAKVLIAASPEPTAVTFTGQDVRLANTEAKSVLRAACGAVAATGSMVDYIPIYEATMLTHPKLVWDPDRLNLSAGFVVKIVRRLQELYLKGEAKAAKHKAGADGAPSLKTARAFLLKVRYPEAEAAARAVLAANPDDADAALLIAEALIGRFRGDEAEDELKPWIERFPDRADLRIALARALARSGRDRLPEAILEINSASRLESMSLAEYRVVAELIRRKAPPTMAEAIMRKAVERNPGAAEAHGFLVGVLADRGKLKDAVEVLRSALELPDAPAAMRLQLADLLIETGGTAEAEDLVRAALADDPESSDAQILMQRLQAAGAVSR